MNRTWKLGLGMAAAVAAAILLSCQDRSSPTAPEERAGPAGEGAEASDATSPRMSVIGVGRSHSTRTIATPGAGPTQPPPTATPVPTGVAPSATPTQPGVPTLTPTPGATSTPPPPTPTRTPTPVGAATVIRLRAVRWAWQWIQGPGTNPGNPSPSINLKAGQTYALHVFNGDIYDEVYLPHYFSGVFGLISGSPLPYGGADYVFTFTAPSVSVQTTYGFSCQEFGCGPTARHEGMLGSIIVDP